MGKFIISIAIFYSYVDLQEDASNLASGNVATAFSDGLPVGLSPVPAQKSRQPGWVEDWTRLGMS